MWLRCQNDVLCWVKLIEKFIKIIRSCWAQTASEEKKIKRQMIAGTMNENKNFDFINSPKAKIGTTLRGFSMAGLGGLLPEHNNFNLEGFLASLSVNKRRNLITFLQNVFVPKSHWGLALPNFALANNSNIFVEQWENYLKIRNFPKFSSSESIACGFSKEK